MKIKILSLVAVLTMLTSEAYAYRHFYCQDKSTSNLKFNVTLNGGELFALNATSMHEGQIILTNFFGLVPCTIPAGNSYSLSTIIETEKLFKDSNGSMFCAISFNFNGSTGDGIVETKINNGLQTHYEVTCKEL